MLGSGISRAVAVDVTEIPGFPGEDRFAAAGAARIASGDLWSDSFAQAPMVVAIGKLAGHGGLFRKGGKSD
jgi:hypothetical protein